MATLTTTTPTPLPPPSASPSSSTTDDDAIELVTASEADLKDLSRLSLDSLDSLTLPSTKRKLSDLPKPHPADSDEESPTPPSPSTNGNTPSSPPPTTTTTKPRPTSYSSRKPPPSILDISPPPSPSSSRPTPPSPTTRQPPPPPSPTTRQPPPSPRQRQPIPPPSPKPSSADHKPTDPTPPAKESRSRRILGEWTMSKTLGAGSMGKVKLGISGVTGEKVAIKIIPRYTSTAALYRPQVSDSPAKSNGGNGREKVTQEEVEKARLKDVGKEVRTMREGSLCLLLWHPYVCGMRSMVLYPNHYYMVFEYVNGGQMLDYIISHGRLRERSARKFARQIGSALEYCHANSIVHRDLKIENILISKTGNIKIIDFGLSNLYTPTSHLSTFCGSLYFAAPELLNAKPYTGPEVDVWSFGIVLYVLVCGKVPFDDQSMPALHAKIKRGTVEYPTWLSAECKHLLSRMLVTTPSLRATLTEVLSHPWMTKGCSGPPTPHLPSRTPLKLEELDPEVIKGMVGFEFGTTQEIEANLTEVLNGELYKASVKAWETRKAGGSNAGGAILGNGEVEEELRSEKDRPATRTDGKDMKGGVGGRSPTNKRFSGLGFYGKKLAGGLNAAFSGAGSGGKGDGELGGSMNSGYSTTPLVGGVRPDQLDPTRGFHPLVSIYFLVREKIEREKIWGPGVFASSTLSLTGPPPPPAPAQAYQAGSGVFSAPRAPELSKSSAQARDALAVGAAALANGHGTAVLAPMTPQPRARATGEEFTNIPASAPAGFERKRRQPSMPTARPSSSYEPPSSPSPASHDRRRSVALASDRDRERTVSSPPPLQQNDDDIPLGSPGQSTFARRFGSLLGRSSPSPEVLSYKGHRQRASIGGTAHKASNKTAVSALPQVTETLHNTGSDVPLPSPPDGKAVHRASTVGELSPTRHQRGVSMGAASTMAGSVGRAQGAVISERRRQVSLGSKPEVLNKLGVDGSGFALDDHAEELVGTDEGGEEGRGPIRQDHQNSVVEVSGGGADQAKPVWLKGLFSVATTSTKPVSVLKADLVRVFERLGVQYREIKSGFECAHFPSIDLSTVGSAKKQSSPQIGSGKGTIRKKASKLLSPTKDSQSIAPDDSQVSLGGGGHSTGTRARTTTSSTSFTDMVSHSPEAVVSAPRFGSSTRDTSGHDLIVRFEVFIVRMPLLPSLNGVRFNRISGNAVTYTMMAKRVLKELKL